MSSTTQGSPRIDRGARPKATPSLARITAMVNLKGGVGKTTNVINLACGLGRGLTHPEDPYRVLPPQRVLIIDFEDYLTGSEWLGVKAQGPWDSCAALFSAPEAEDALGLDDALPEEHVTKILSLPRPARYEPVDVIPSETAGVKATDMASQSERALKANLDVLRREYDHIFLDLPAVRDNLMFRSTLVAADGVLIPVVPVAAVLKLMKPLMIRIKDVQRGANPRLQVDGWLMSRAGAKNSVYAQQAQADLSQVPGYYTFRSMIRTLVPIEQSSAVNRSVFAMPNNGRAVRDYSHFIFEWLDRITQEEER